MSGILYLTMINVLKLDGGGVHCSIYTANGAREVQYESLPEWPLTHTGSKTAFFACIWIVK